MRMLLHPVRERIFSRWMWRLPPGSDRIVLTFDDGPGPETPALLAVLKHLSIPCTYFAVAANAEKYAGELRAVVADEHEIANHSFNHANFRYRSADYQRQNLLHAHQILTSITGRETQWFRPPYGGFNFWTADVLKRLNYRGVLWSAMTYDWKWQSADKIWSGLRPQLQDGAIIVLHDGHVTLPSVMKMLPWLAEEAARRGWQFTTLSSAQIQLN
jgi:peptidoglycan-N-acetylglucosamine deacetylase